MTKKLKKKISSPYFYQREKEKNLFVYQKLYESNGSILVTFTSEIKQIKAGDKDLLGTTWNPKNRVDKFQAKCRIKDKDFIYEFGGRTSGVFKAFMYSMMINNLINKDIEGSSWRIRCVDFSKYKWEIEFLGKD